MKRITKIAELTSMKSTIDIGSDHGYLLLEIAKKSNDNLLGIEINEGPYENLKNNIKKSNLENQIKCIKSNGLNKITELDVLKYDNVVISGMGGNLITDIIDKEMKKFENINLILQPNNNEYKVRKFLTHKSFEITKEFLVKENNIIYSIMCAKYKKNKNFDITKDELIFGINLKYNDIFIEKWRNDLNYFLKLKKTIPKKDSEEIKKKIDIIKKKIGEI